MTDAALNDALLAAHDRNDKRALIDLYTQAADQAETRDAECFFLTYAYVFALELGTTAQNGLEKRLKHHGRL